MATGQVRDKIALVTGAASGIGRAAAMMLAQEGAKVFVSDIILQAAETVANEIRASGGSADALRLNVADESEWLAVMEFIANRNQRLDILVNNAGISFAKPVADMTFEEWRRVLAVNLDGVFLGMRCGIRAMSAGAGGSIINIASVSGISAFLAAGAYGASKAAVRHLSRVVAIECADAKNGVRINVVTPSGVRTPMWETMDFFQELVTANGGTDEAFAAIAGTAGSRRFFSAEEVARTIVYLASDESSHLTGTEVVMAQGHA